MYKFLSQESFSALQLDRLLLGNAQESKQKTRESKAAPEQSLEALLLADADPISNLISPYRYPELLCTILLSDEHLRAFVAKVKDKKLDLATLQKRRDALKRYAHSQWFMQWVKTHAKPIFERFYFPNCPAEDKRKLEEQFQALLSLAEKPDYTMTAAATEYARELAEGLILIGYSDLFPKAFSYYLNLLSHEDSKEDMKVGEEPRPASLPQLVKLLEANKLLTVDCINILNHRGRHSIWILAAALKILQDNKLFDFENVEFIFRGSMNVKDSVRYLLNINDPDSAMAKQYKALRQYMEHSCQALELGKFLFGLDEKKQTAVFSLLANECNSYPKKILPLSCVIGMYRFLMACQDMREDIEVYLLALKNKLNFAEKLGVAIHSLLRDNLRWVLSIPGKDQGVISTPHRLFALVLKIFEKSPSIIKEITDALKYLYKVRPLSDKDCDRIASLPFVKLHALSECIYILKLRNQLKEYAERLLAKLDDIIFIWGAGINSRGMLKLDPFFDNPQAAFMSIPHEPLTWCRWDSHYDSANPTAQDYTQLRFYSAHICRASNNPATGNRLYRFGGGGASESILHTCVLMVAGNGTYPFRETLVRGFFDEFRKKFKSSKKAPLPLAAPSAQDSQPAEAPSTQSPASTSTVLPALIFP